MTTGTWDKALVEAIGPTEGAGLRIKQVVLVILGIAALAIAAKIKVPLWPSPVPITLGTFAVLTIGAAYGPMLGLTTILGYMALGALGMDVFTSSSPENNGLAYMLGGTGGYLVGYVLAVFALGVFARKGWDRTVGQMGLGMLVGTVLIYVPGVAWLHYLVTTQWYDATAFATPFAQTLQWGLTPFLIGDFLKLALAALLVPAVWKLVGKARG